MKLSVVVMGLAVSGMAWATSPPPEDCNQKKYTCTYTTTDGSPGTITVEVVWELPADSVNKFAKSQLKGKGIAVDPNSVSCK